MKRVADRAAHDEADEQVTPGRHAAGLGATSAARAAVVASLTATLLRFRAAVGAAAPTVAGNNVGAAGIASRQSRRQAFAAAGAWKRVVWAHGGEVYRPRSRRATTGT